MGQFLPAHFDRGDPDTVGGYFAVHGRPPAFEGSDGSSYSVEIVVDDVGGDDGRYGAYLMFVRWRKGDPVAAGHVETDYLRSAPTEEDARAAIGKMQLQEARAALEAALVAG